MQLLNLYTTPTLSRLYPLRFRKSFQEDFASRTSSRNGARTFFRFAKFCPDHDLSELSSSTSDAVRFQIMLSLHYYRVSLLINEPILTRILSAIIDSQTNEREIAMILDDALPAAKNDYIAAKCLQAIINSICVQLEPFLNRNGAWWICNYTSKGSDTSLWNEFG